MKVLIACEESQTVCKAFRARGHEAYSCDIIPCSGGHPEWHIQDDVLNHLNENWDLMIAHPPCTYLTVTGNRWFNISKYGEKALERQKLRIEALEFVKKLLDADIPKIALENPVGAISTHIRKPDQYIQPYEFGHKDSKKTGLWLKNLPLLKPTNIVEPEYVIISGKRYSKTHAYSWNNSKLRSKTYEGIANAMAEQWR